MKTYLSVSGTFSDSINFAMQQNFVSVVRNMVVRNETDQTLENLELRLTSQPEFSQPFVCPIGVIGPGEAVEIAPVKLILNTPFLFSLTEKLVGALDISIAQGEETVYRESREIALLAYDQWSGLNAMPELTAAFIMPNLPQLAPILRDASALLGQWTGTPSFTAYQTQNPNQVKLQMAALYTTLAKQGLGYNLPPASFEKSGQRIRLPHIVLEQKQGTCLDLAVLYASCLEAVGLHALLFFTDGHAFCGCWLEEATFADCVVDDLSAIEKRMAAGAEELLAVECTDFVAGKQKTFDQAMAQGLENLHGPAEFLCAIDIQRVRVSGIRPIPLGLEGERVPLDAHAQEEISTQAPAALDESLRGRVVEGSGPDMTKTAVWERKLLDLSLRNNLLNFRTSKNALQLLTADLSQLENQISDGKSFQILGLPQELSPTEGEGVRTAESLAALEMTLAAEEFKNGRLRARLSDQNLQAAMASLSRAARTSLEESGSNTLFLALGFLRWYESARSEKPRYAPIVLIPVDIVRTVRARGYQIRSRQEDAQMNVTLLEYLRQDQGLAISGLDPLPHDDHGVDLPLVLHTLRQGVLAKKRWNIEERACLGLFSFGQFVMWNDLRNRSAELRESQVVSSLMEGRLTWEPEGSPIPAQRLDEEINLQEMAVPVSADSSQMVAIAAAAAGRSFVLHGPPGTGKSQTITNMIANALYQGKSVLFVAEKMAALNVVQNRLAGIGLDPFCLELHSNKAKKATVLAQLEKALEVGRVKAPEEYQALAQKLHHQRSQLNHIITALHAKQSWGGSLYDAICQFRGQTLGQISFDQAALSSLTREQLERWDACVHRFRMATQGMGAYAQHPLREVGVTHYTLQTRDAFRRETEELRGQMEALAQDCRRLTGALGAEGRQDRATVTALLELVVAAAGPGQILPELLSGGNQGTLLPALSRLVQIGRRYRDSRADLLRRFDAAILDYPVDSARLRWKQAQQQWLLARIAGQNKLLKELRLYAKTPADVTKDNLLTIYQELADAAALGREVREIPAAVAGALGGVYLGVQTDWEEAQAALDKTRALAAAWAAIPGSAPAGNQAALTQVAASQELGEIRRRLTGLFSALDAYAGRYQLDLTEAEQSPDWPKALGKVLTRLSQNTELLRDVALYRQAEQALAQEGLALLAQAYRAGSVTSDQMERAYRANLSYALALTAIDSDERLRSFHGREYDDLIDLYAQAMDEYRGLTIQELAARLSAKVPTTGNLSAASSEIGILKRAIKSGGRSLSLRKLFEQIPVLLRRLCPCMLMSPISVAQYIDPSFPKFDLVIFDEASQLPTSEAVGAIARGKNVVVVGDPKQLPPTNFFNVNRIDEEHYQLEDLESLLDDCLALSMPQEYLKWHYRSRHESLIAYSNMKYYDNKLYTFPSPNDLKSQVRLIPVEGVYEKGGSKQNRAEAQAIVAEILRRLSDPELCRDSIGVVTFSSVQQNLIDDLLCEEWEKHPELDEQNRAAAEPIFIKNLENVQGDERDVILFSVGYGPDKDGHVSMNFGPLNRDGGWRRLNVAISRARKEMVVYSVLRPEQIDLARTRAEGVAGLKGFLEYARSGKTALAQRSGLAQPTPDTVADEIAAAIASLGCKVQRNVGCSSFRVDIGIVDPNQEETFLLGILLDGRNCCHSATALDRFVLQPSVLEGLGWKVLRLWTLDWLDNPSRVLEGVVAAMRQAQTPPTPPQAQETPRSFEAFGFERMAAAPSLGVPYTPAQLPDLGTGQDFYDSRTKGKITAAVAQVLAAEAPISRKLLCKKVLGAWGLSRGSARSDAIFTQALEGLGAVSTWEGEQEFLWRKDQDPASYAQFRVEPADARRSMDDVPREELQCALLEVLTEQISLSGADLIRETARKFGYTRVGGVIEGALSEVIAWTLEQGRIVQTPSGNFMAGAAVPPDNGEPLSGQ